MSRVPKEAVDGNALFEGYHKKLADGRAAPYLCPARVATIGYGTTRYPTGKVVKLSDAPILQPTARTYMANDLQVAAVGLDKYAKVALHDLQRSALIMFANNCGVGALRHSTLLFFVNRKEWSKAAREFLKWVNGGGQRLSGLVRRRKYESEMFARGSQALTQSTGVTRAAPVAAPVAASKSIPSATAPAGGGFLSRLWHFWN